MKNSFARYSTFIFVVACAVTLSGCLGPAPEETTGEAKDDSQEMNTVTPASNEGEIVTDASVEKFKKLLSSGKKVSCNYSLAATEDQPQPTKVGIVMESEKKYQIITENTLGKTYGLSDGENMYFWTEGTKQGTRMSFKCMEAIAAKYKDSANDPMSNYEQYKFDSNEEALDQLPSVDCVEGGDVNISVPKDVTFVDQCQMLEKMQTMMKKMPSGAMPQTSMGASGSSH